jgi:serine/threonine protein phosphatase 1
VGLQARGRRGGGNENRIHAGWNPRRSADEQTDDELRWSQPVFIGHYSTLAEWSEPRRVLEVWNLDQGAGWGGRLTVMDAVTGQWWQSDPVRELYG